MLCFSMIRVSGESKSRLVKAAGAESCGQRRNRKTARRCGEKHILKWKCTKHVSSRPLFEVGMSKNCTPLWRETRFQVKMLKNWRSHSIQKLSPIQKLLPIQKLFRFGNYSQSETRPPPPLGNQCFQWVWFKYYILFVKIFLAPPPLLGNPCFQWFSSCQNFPPPLLPLLGNPCFQWFSFYQNFPRPPSWQPVHSITELQVIHSFNQNFPRPLSSWQPVLSMIRI